MTKDQKIDRLTLGLKNIAKYALNQQAREMASNTLDLETPLREMVSMTYEVKDGG